HADHRSLDDRTGDLPRIPQEFPRAPVRGGADARHRGTRIARGGGSVDASDATPVRPRERQIANGAGENSNAESPDPGQSSGRRSSVAPSSRAGLFLET